MHVHLLGICGTFMGSLSLLARQLGYKVTGQDTNVYPPMSTQLKEHGVDINVGYDVSGLDNAADVIVVGNVMRRGMPVIEHLLATGRTLLSGPEFLSRYILPGKQTLVVSGTHGKTTTSSMLAWIMEYAGLNPGFLIGGVPKNFPTSARITDSPYFVLEGDEYDSAFFDKRSKFIHYHPTILIINNIEFDHADIFRDVIAIQDQFHHLIRTVPATGQIIAPVGDKYIDEVLERGCWTPSERFGINEGDWQLAHIENKDWPFWGQYNYLNAMAAIAAANHVGVDVKQSVKALASFAGVKRRLEVIAQVNDITVYNDFAHHPTAIKLTLEALQAKIQGKGRVLAVVDICSNSMRSGVHKEMLGEAIQNADQVYFYHDKQLAWDVADINVQVCGVFQQQDKLIAQLLSAVQAGDQVVLMSNGAFGGLHGDLVTGITQLARKTMAID